MTQGVAGYPAYQYSLFRIVFGSYLLLHFLFLVPAAPDIWSNLGILADPTLNFTFGTFPNILNVMDSQVAGILPCVLRAERTSVSMSVAHGLRWTVWIA